MAGQLATHAPHLDGSEDVGVWFDAAWSLYLDLMIRLGEIGLEPIDDMYEELCSVDEPGQPTAETWGTSEKAQRGQEAMFAMLGGMGGPTGAAPATGES